jgi:hypothetical protein
MLLRMPTRARVPFAAIVVMPAVLALACRHAAPPIRFAPDGTDGDQLRRVFALSDAERTSLTPETLRRFTQAQLDQIYARLSTGPVPDGPFRGDLFLPRGAPRQRVRDIASDLPVRLSAVAAMPLEDLGRAFWKGKVFFKSEGILRNRIEDLAVLKPLVKDTASIPKLTFDGATTWLLFPARVTCGNSLIEPAQRAIVIDYSKGPQIDGYREIPDGLAGPDALDIHDEVRAVRPGLYLGRAYFRGRFRLNFTLLKPEGAPGAPADVTGDCS